jgi:WD40 repeat protein
MTPKRVVDSEFGKTVATIREPRRSGRAIYCVDWSTDVVSSQPSPPPPLNATPDDCTARTSSTSSSQCFASCGGRYISIYTVRGDPSNRIVKVKYAYFDEDTSEDFYACAFAGRSSEAFPLDPTDDDEEDAEEDSVDDAVEDTVEDTSAARPPYTDPTGIWPLAEHTGSGPQLLAVAGKTGIIKVLDPVKGRFVACLRQYNEADGETSTEILDLKVSSVDEHLLLSASKDTAICIWNMKLGSCVAMCAGPPSHQDPVVSVAWHPSDTYFASSSSDKTIKIWDIGPGTAVREAIQQSHEAAEAWRNEKTLRILHSPLIVTPCWSSCKLHDGLVDRYVVVNVQQSIASLAAADCARKRLTHCVPYLPPTTTQHPVRRRHDSLSVVYRRERGKCQRNPFVGACL